MIGTTLKKLLDEQHTNVNELSRRIGVSAQTLYSIIKRDNMKIDFDMLLKICNTLHVPVELFLPGDAQTPMPDAGEWELIRKYRLLDAHGRHMAELVLDAECDRVSAAPGRGSSHIID